MGCVNQVTLVSCCITTRKQRAKLEAKQRTEIEQGSDATKTPKTTKLWKVDTRSSKNTPGHQPTMTWISDFLTYARLEAKQLRPGESEQRTAPKQESNWRNSCKIGCLPTMLVWRRLRALCTLARTVGHRKDAGGCHRTRPRPKQPSR